MHPAELAEGRAPAGAGIAASQFFARQGLQEASHPGAAGATRSTGVPGDVCVVSSLFAAATHLDIDGRFAGGGADEGRASSIAAHDLIRPCCRAPG